MIPTETSARTRALIYLRCVCFQWNLPGAVPRNDGMTHRQINALPLLPRREEMILLHSKNSKLLDCIEMFSLSRTEPPSFSTVPILCMREMYDFPILLTMNVHIQFAER